jgi:hypothetical protein
MKTRKLYLIISLLFLSLFSFSQGFLISSMKLNFDGEHLHISYDVINKNQSDQFYVWVEIEKKNGETINIKALSGDVGENIKSGTNKEITWVPKDDSVFLDEEVFVEVKAERYVKLFNKGSAMLKSTVFPGLGQTKISNGKPWWLTGVAAYGALAGGLVVRKQYLNTYDSYRVEEDPASRSDLLNQAQNKMNLSTALVVSGAAIWVANIFWVALTPNQYKPLQNLKLSLDQSQGPFKGSTLLTLKYNF